jgi:hypothetical protein
VRGFRWLIILPAIAFALFAKPAKADTLGEWTYSQSCPTSGSIEVIDDTIILHGPDQNGCAGQPHWVKIETTIPADVDTIDFTWSYQTSDGWWYDPPQYGINGAYTLITQQNNSTGSMSIPVSEGDLFSFRQYSVDTCCAPGHLTISNLSLWASITTSTTSTTTSTTTVPSTTVPATVLTTTTVPETTTTTTTSSTSTTTTVPETTTSTTISTTTTSTTTTSTTTTSTTTTVPKTTTSTSTTTTSTTTTTSSTTSTTTTSTTVYVPQITLPVLEPTTTLPPETSTTTTLPPELPVLIPTTLLPTTTVSQPSTTTTSLPPVVETTTTLPVVETTTTLPVVETLQDISTKSNEEIAAIATNPGMLATVSSQEAAQIFESLDVAELSDEQTEELVAAVQEAPLEVRQQFEDKIDVFKSGLDTYVPIGSTIPVGTRRTLIAVTAGISLAAAGTRIRR